MGVATRQELSAIVRAEPRVSRLLAMLWEHSPKKFEHSLRVGRKAAGLAMHMTRRKATDFTRAGYLHDVGQLFMEAEALENQGRPLTPEEWRQNELHPLIGYEMLRDEYPQTALLVRDHHRFQPFSYPRLDEPPAPLARLLSVIDADDATLYRPEMHNTYKHA